MAKKHRVISKIYIAGPISADPENMLKHFHEFDKKLSELGHAVLNPALLPKGLEEHEYMDICCSMVRVCDNVFMLDGWEKSEGATAEYYLAKKLGKNIFHQEDVTI